MEDERQGKKTKVIMKITKKMDTMKHEMYNTHQYRQKFRTLLDFEKKSRMTHYKHIVRPKQTRKSTLEARKKVRTLYQYLWDVKIIPLYKILKDTHKVVLYSEWLYFYRELEVSYIGNEILRESKKKNVITSSTDDRGAIKITEHDLNNTISRIRQFEFTKALKIKQLNNSIKRYFNKVSQVLPDGFPLALKNTPCVPIFLKRQIIEESSQKNSLPLTTVEKYKMFLKTYKQCEGSKSIYYRFNKVHYSSSLHPSFTNCLKKIPVARQESKSVKELCLYTSKEEDLPEEGVKEVGVDLLHQPNINIDSVYDTLTPLKYKIDFINLYLGDIAPDTICLPPIEVFYPFDSSKIDQNEPIGEDNSTSNVIQNNLYGV